MQADVLRETVDGILLTDNRFGQVHMSTLAAASILMGVNVDPIVQLTSINRNRIALVSDLLGAGAIGVTSLVLVAGESPPKELNPKPKRVHDLNATELIRTADTIKKDEKLKRPPDFFIGGVVTPIAPGPNWRPKKLLEKIEAGAQFLQTHTCMNVEVLRRYTKRFVEKKFAQRASIIGSVAVLESADDVRWLREHRPNVIVPDPIIERLQDARRPQQEGIRICAETIMALREIPGIDGISIMATRDLSSIPKALRAAGLGD